MVGNHRSLGLLGEPARLRRIYRTRRCCHRWQRPMVQIAVAVLLIIYMVLNSSSVRSLLRLPDTHCLATTTDGVTPNGVPKQWLTRVIPSTQSRLVHLIVAGTSITPHLRRFLVTARLHGFDSIAVLGEGKRWQGFVQSKIAACIQHLEVMTDSKRQMVALVDSDVIFRAGPAELSNAFARAVAQQHAESAEGAVLLGSEPHCGKTVCFKNQPVVINALGFRMYVNGGFVMGEARDVLSYLLTLWRFIPSEERYHADDQWWVGRLMSEQELPKGLHLVLDADSLASVTLVGNQTFNYKQHMHFKEAEKAPVVHIPNQRSSEKTTTYCQLYAEEVQQIYRQHTASSTWPPRVSNSRNTKRKEAVVEAIKHAWGGYWANARSYDDLHPLSNGGTDWLHSQATLYDSLDTLWLAGLYSQFYDAVAYIRDTGVAIPLRPVKLFEYHIRVVGGLIGAHAVSGEPILLDAARRAASAMLASSFRERHVLPHPYSVLGPTQGVWSWMHRVWALLWGWGRDALDEHQVNSLAGMGTFSLEFEYLSRETGDPTYAAAADRIFDVLAGKALQAEGAPFISSLWSVNDAKPLFDDAWSLGTGADSFWEYTLKTPLLGCKGRDRQQVKMLKVYQALANALAVDGNIHVVKGENDAANHRSISFLQVFLNKRIHPCVHLHIVSEQDGTSLHHLLCYLPGLLALGSSALHRDQDLPLAEELLEGCVQAYQTTGTHIGPESTPVNQTIGSAKLMLQDHSTDSKYILRPEYVESLFVLHRITKDPRYQELGWDVFLAIERHCRTETGYAGLLDVRNGSAGLIDEMPSFFIAETLKYLLMLFDPYMLPLDEWVFLMLKSKHGTPPSEACLQILHEDQSLNPSATFTAICIFPIGMVVLACGWFKRHSFRRFHAKSATRDE